MIDLVPGELTITTVESVVFDHAQVTLGALARKRITDSCDYADRVAAQRPLYGRSTGVGANRTVPVDDPAAQLQRLVRSHATAMGAPRSVPRVRTMVLVRLAQLCAGGSGISLDPVLALVDGLNADALPMVRDGGGIGTGDLSALAAIGVWLLDTPSPRLRPGDGLPLLSSNAATIADAMLALGPLARLADFSTQVAALTLRATYGNPEAFAPAVQAAVPFPGTAAVCERMRAVLHPDWSPARIQDPYALRAMPQVHGACVDAISDSVRVTEALAVAPSENPSFLPGFEVAHHASFLTMHVALTLETSLSAIATSAAQSLARTVLLADPAFTGVSSFASDGVPGASGTMMVEYAAAARLAELRALAVRTSGDEVTLSRGVEEDAGFASQAALRALAAVDLWQSVLAAEILTAARVLALQDRLARVPVAAAPLTTPLAQRAGNTGDRDLSDDLARALDVVRARTGTPVPRYAPATPPT